MALGEPVACAALPQRVPAATAPPGILAIGSLLDSADQESVHAEKTSKAARAFWPFAVITLAAALTLAWTGAAPWLFVGAATPALAPGLADRQHALVDAATDAATRVVVGLA
jgi:hypothetical protein